MIPYLKNLYTTYNIDSLLHGARGDKLGDLYEEVVIDSFTPDKYKKEQMLCNLRTQILDSYDIAPEKVLTSSAHSNIPKRNSNGNSKTDVLVNLNMIDGSLFKLRISVKQTSASKVSIAEYDVNTIFNEVGINKNDEPLLYKLMLKHQFEASAKNFTLEEKEGLSDALYHYKQSFLRWIFTMDPNEHSTDDRVPTSIIIFKVSKESEGSIYLTHNVYQIQNYIEYISLDKKGIPKRGGFGTGLSWTYATGSKGTKIQFKG